MLDLRGRSRVAPILDPIAAGLAKARLTPTMITILGLVVTLVGAAYIAVDRYALGGFVAGVGVALDALDGPLARYQGTASIRGAFIDTMADRFGEVGLWTGLTFSLRADETGLMLCLLGLAFSLLTPYVRSKAESWGAEGRGGWMGRGERMILLLVGLMCTGWGLKVLHPMLWIFVVLSGLTVAQRSRRTWQQLGVEDESERAT
ncbi:MAG: CDP-alcohol phosphatidyltransferase family protein [Acidimicrobiia bacterium]|nr:CDP-alcohol phosphatidyltransferase family protein [Acidimicrobiia bacterium]MDX2467471.1 CDP-alcohol phosphatidyltransferase family protein [Acidimicrobiia bacterium]